MDALLTVEDLALILKKSVHTVRDAASKRPHTLPPICRLPGTKRLYWKAAVVDCWINSFGECETPAPAMAGEPLPKKPRVGRPPKAEEIARRRAKGG